MALKTFSSRNGSGQQRALLLVYVAVLTLIAIPAWILAEDPAWWPVMGIVMATAAWCLILILRTAGYEWQSGPVAYLLLLWLFHFPLTLLVALGVNFESRLPQEVLAWLETSDWYRASAFAGACAGAFVIGCLVALRGTPAGKATPRADVGLYGVGLATSALALCGLAALFIAAGGVNVFSGSYGSLYDSLFGSTFTLMCFMVTAGAIISILNSTRTQRWAPIAFQVAASTLTLLTGARQYALVGALVICVVAAKVGLRIKPKLFFCGVLLLLSVISFVGARRGDGVLVSSSDTSNVGPIAAMAEMGGSLQTASLVVGWIEGGDPPQWGGGYWLPIERAVGLVIPSVRSDLSTDRRALSELLTSRAPTLGGSVVAESYYNFKFLGVLVFIVFGYLLGYIEQRACTPFGLAFGGIALYALTLEIRNWFLGVPAMLVLGAIPIVIGISIRKKRHQGHQDRPEFERRRVSLPRLSTTSKAPNNP